MPWIQNVALSDVVNGFHKGTETDTVLIRIFDPASALLDSDKSKPEKRFLKTYVFEFLDVEDDDPVTGFPEFAITESQASEIADILKDCLEKDLNVVVHCFAGICRSGAVCEVGVILGFEDLNLYRNPNLLVKKKLLEALGLNHIPFSNVENLET